MTSSRPSEFAKYSDLFEKLLDATVLLDVNTFNILDANPATMRLFETSSEKILGQSIFRWVNEHEIEGVKKALASALAQNEPLVVNSRLQNERRRFIIVQTVICTLKLSNETQVLQFIAKDITEEHEAKQKSVNQLVKIAEMNRRLEMLSVTDEMTRLFNFRCFKEKLLQEHIRSERYNLVYSILFCDVDNFKHYNDQNGHPAGDALLKQLAQILQTAVRNTDIVARYGGEEFAVICPATPDHNAQILAERIRAKVESFPFAYAVTQPLGKVSISVGVASYPLNGKTAEEVLQAADQAVYASKHNGRNRVTLATSLDRSQLSSNKKKLD